MAILADLIVLACFAFALFGVFLYEDPFEENDLFNEDELKDSE